MRVSLMSAFEVLPGHVVVFPTCLIFELVMHSVVNEYHLLCSHHWSQSPTIVESVRRSESLCSLMGHHFLCRSVCLSHKGPINIDYSRPHSCLIMVAFGEKSEMPIQFFYFFVFGLHLLTVMDIVRREILQERIAG